MKPLIAYDTETTGITTERAMDEGIDEKEAVEQFIALWKPPEVALWKP